GRGGEVLDRGLLGQVAILTGQSVERVEGPTAEPFGEPDHHRDIGLELGPAVRLADHAALTVGHVAGEEVQGRELDAGVLERSGELVDLGLRRGRLGEGPPELRGAEAGPGDGGGPVAEREPGQQDGTVHRTTEQGQGPSESRFRVTKAACWDVKG